MKTLTTTFILLALASPVWAQNTKHEIGLLFGALSTGSRDIQLPSLSKAEIGVGGTYLANYA